MKDDKDKNETGNFRLTFRSRRISKMKKQRVDSGPVGSRSRMAVVMVVVERWKFCEIGGQHRKEMNVTRCGQVKGMEWNGKSVAVLSRSKKKDNLSMKWIANLIYKVRSDGYRCLLTFALKSISFYLVHVQLVYIFSSGNYYHLFCSEINFIRKAPIWNFVFFAFSASISFLSSFCSYFVQDKWLIRPQDSHRHTRTKLFQDGHSFATGIAQGTKEQKLQKKLECCTFKC